MGLSGIDHGSAKVFIDFRQCAGTPVQLAADPHLLVRIGTDHRNVPVDPLFQRIGIIGRMVLEGIAQTDAEQDIGLVRLAKAQVEPLIQVRISLPPRIRAHRPENLVPALGQFFAGRISGRDAVIIGIGWHTKREEIVDHLLLWHGRIRDETDFSALFTKVHQRPASLFKGIAAIMDHAPDIAQDGVILASNLGQAARKFQLCHAFGPRLHRQAGQSPKPQASAGKGLRRQCTAVGMEMACAKKHPFRRVIWPNPSSEIRFGS